MRVSHLLVVLALSGCRVPERVELPSGFLLGSAISGFQAEMGCPTLPAERCEDRGSDWYAFITDEMLRGDPGLFISGDSPRTGPGFFELYAQDLDRVQTELHHDSLRLSLEWSRLFPTATDALVGHAALRAAASPPALAYYHALFAAMKARGVAPLVTLNHYTLPLWIHDAVACHADLDACTAKGWIDRERIVREIAKYAGFAAQEFGAEVDLWATLNEPLSAIVLPGYLFQTVQRTNPPGVFLRADAAHTAFAAMAEAHARMYEAIKAADLTDADADGQACSVGLVYNIQPVVAADPRNPLDVQAAKNADYIINQAFLDAVGSGLLDAELDGQPTPRADLMGKLDYLGVNYYAQLTVEGAEQSYFPSISPLLTFNPLSIRYDFAYPRGVYEALTWAGRYGVPLFVTETGFIDDADTGQASGWLVKTLAFVGRAMREGINVGGYYYWTLMDNYEWNHGMSIKMGLYAVDPADPQKQRRPRNIVTTYGDIGRERAIPAALTDAYPIE